MDKLVRHSSFDRVGVVLEHAVDYLAAIDSVLEGLTDEMLSPRAALLARSAVIDERRLLGAVERYLEDAPSLVLNTYVPYTALLPPVQPPSGLPLSVASLARWLISLHQSLANLARQLSASAAHTEGREALSALAAQIEAHERALSKSWVRLEDL
ncbi:MAG: hypothetical protein ACO377_07485 [Pseudomonadales bacterium]